MGASIDTLPHGDVATALFAESAGRLVVEVQSSDVNSFTAIAGPALALGTVSNRPVMSIAGVFDLDVTALTAAFSGNDW